MTDFFDVVVVRVNEKEHQDDRFTTKAEAVSVDADGKLTIKTTAGSRSMPASSWGAISITRVPSAKDRL